jgi:hypothetical protein
MGNNYFVETNNERLYQVPNETTFVKDGINNHIINGDTTVNPGKLEPNRQFGTTLNYKLVRKALELIKQHDNRKS